MSCKKYEKWINLFWDSRLSQSQEEEFKKHLAECRECQKNLAFLELVEGKAKGIRAKEPAKKYWDTFSSRVREKIVTSKEKSTAFGWRKTFANVFVLSPWKIRIATGVVSIVLVFIIGKLYIDYRGKTIIPKAPATSAVKEAPLSITEMKKGENSFPTESPHKIATPLEQPKKAQPIVVSDQEKGKVPSPVVEGADKQTGLKEQKVRLTEKAAEQKSISPPAPIAEEKGVTPIVKPQAGETPTQITEQPVPAQAAPVAGAGKGIDTTITHEVALLSQRIKAGEERESLQERKDLGSMNELGKITEPYVTKANVLRNNYVIDESPITRIDETDTLMQAVDLRGIIQRWKDHFQDHPSDSINQQGYLQVATAYLLLNRLSPDSTLVNQGSYLIEDYMNRTKDPAIKEQLSDKLEKMKALGKK